MRARLLSLLLVFPAAAAGENISKASSIPPLAAAVMPVPTPLAPIVAAQPAALGLDALISAAKPEASAPLEAASQAVFDGVRLAAPENLVAAPAAPSSLSGAALFQALHEQTRRGHRERDYESASDYLFTTADRRAVGGRSGIVDAYSGVFVEGDSKDGAHYPERGDRNGDGHIDDSMNVEHLWPQSFFSRRLPMRSDLHQLMATFSHPNSVRSNFPFGVVRGSGEYSNAGGAKLGQGVFEPPNQAKGRVARAMLYFYVRYHDQNIYNSGFNQKFWNANIELFLDWNRRFPPDGWERARNGLVESFQGNRNPFIDDHALADRVGGDALMRRPRQAAPRPKRARGRRRR